jgi:uncharacterized protein (DUF58 family)
MSIISTAIERFDLRRFFRGEGPQRQPVTLHQKKVYIFPTRQGMVFGILLLLMLLGSINYGNSLGFILTFLLASLTVITILYTYRNLLDLKISIGNIEPVYCQQAMSVPFIFTNTHYARFSISLSYSKHPDITFDLTQENNQLINYFLTANVRGLHKLQKFTFSTTFPLGLFRAWSYFEVDKDYLVYPKPAGRPQLPDNLFYKATLLGDQGQGSDDFAGQRKYHPGDSLKHVNWKALAKEQDLLTKQFGGDRCEELWLNWASTQGLSTELRLSQLALWIIEAQRLGLSYGLNIPDQEIPPSHGDLHLNLCMKTLALFK